MSKDRLDAWNAVRMWIQDLRLLKVAQRLLVTYVEWLINLETQSTHIIQDRRIILSFSKECMSLMSEGDTSIHQWGNQHSYSSSIPHSRASKPVYSPLQSTPSNHLLTRCPTPKTLISQFLQSIQLFSATPLSLKNPTLESMPVSKIKKASSRYPPTSLWWTWSPIGARSTSYWTHFQRFTMRIPASP